VCLEANARSVITDGMDKLMKQFTDKVAIVTGASAGIGLATATVLA